MLFHAYIDDSADRKRERVVVAAAIIAAPHAWDRMSKRWNARLAQDGIAYFKSSHCDTLNGQFHKCRALGMQEGRLKAASIRDDLDQILLTSDLTALGVTLSIPSHRAMLSDPEKYGPVPTVPYRLAFQQAIAECAKAMQLLGGRGNILQFGHDNGNDFEALRSLYIDFKKRNRRYLGILGDFLAFDDKEKPPVQAADLAAYVTLRFINAHAADPAGDHLKRLRGRMYKIVNWLDDLRPFANVNVEDAPAHADYAP